MVNRLRKLKHVSERAREVILFGTSTVFDKHLLRKYRSLGASAAWGSYRFARLKLRMGHTL